MQDLKQMGGGFLLAALSLLVVIGGLTLALAEGAIPSSGFDASEQPTDEMEFATSEELGDLSFLLTVWPSDTPLAVTLTSISFPFTSTVVPPTNTELYAPSANPTYTVIPCGAPAGWVYYIVQPGDTLYHIGQLYRSTVSQLQQANCLGASTSIYAGQRLWVPNVSTSTPPSTPIEIEFDTVTPIPSDTPPPTPTPTATNTDLPTPTATSAPPTPTPTSSPSPTGTSPS
jgi:hypothetical protein